MQSFVTRGSSHSVTGNRWLSSTLFLVPFISILFTLEVSQGILWGLRLKTYREHLCMLSKYKHTHTHFTVQVMSGHHDVWMITKNSHWLNRCFPSHLPNGYPTSSLGPGALLVHILTHCLQWSDIPLNHGSSQPTTHLPNPGMPTLCSMMSVS
jgi:hypothetical protein